ncbi:MULTISPECIES: ABC transporter substrate-binding protein [Neobacillus]|uniref:ABC transporter substrate-binding protein n=1 Tax=Neobacillus citreus TaxID=2833578 RepID=A0A942SUZ2_9BACI|nr:ABC transporter substrate-binding protein [Neobacillus citreus]MCH6263947.1 ABC transporter substrate-binding protein [Neobacillus citreus]
MVKKGFTVFTAFMMVFLLAACSGEKTSSNNATVGKDSNELAQGVTKNEILVGHSAPQTGPVAVYDTFRKGMDTYFQYINEKGGVNGRKIKLIAYDDQYQPTKASQNAKKLVEEDKVFAVIGNQGSAANLAAKDYYINKGVPVILPGTGLKGFVDPPVKNWMGATMMNYEVEAQIMLNYAVNELGAKKIAIAYQNDDFGKAPYNKIKEMIKTYPGVELVAEVTYLPADTEFSAQAQKLQQAKPDTIFNFGVMSPVVNLKKAMYKIGLDKANYIVSSIAGGDTHAFQLAGGDVWEGTYSGGILISLDDENNEKIKLFKERFKKSYPNEQATNFVESGWSAGQVFVEALKRTGDNLTWDNFLKSFNSFDNWDGSMYAGVSFSDKNHYGITKMYMTKAENGKIQQISDSIEFDPETGKISLPKK